MKRVVPINLTSSNFISLTFTTTDTISCPLLNSRFLRYNKQQDPFIFREFFSTLPDRSWNGINLSFSCNGINLIGQSRRHGSEPQFRGTPLTGSSFLTLLDLTTPSLSPSPSRAPESPEKLSERIWKKCGHESSQDPFVVTSYPRRNHSLE